MKKPNFSKFVPLAKESFFALGLVMATAFFLMAANQDVVGEGVIALVFLVPVAWSAYHWGLGAGMSAALSAALMFDFFFIHPFYTFTVAQPEGILILIIFFGVAIIIVESIQTTLSRARTNEYEAVTMYEFSTLLAALRSQPAIALSVARFIHQRYLARQVIVWMQIKGQPEKTIAQEPREMSQNSTPDCIIPVINSWGLVGEVQIWRSPDFALPSAESRLFRNLALQIGLAIERVEIMQYEIEHVSQREKSHA